jgi:hypothetical protein
VPCRAWLPGAAGTRCGIVHQSVLPVHGGRPHGTLHGPLGGGQGDRQARSATTFMARNSFRWPFSATNVRDAHALCACFSQAVLLQSGPMLHTKIPY